MGRGLKNLFEKQATCTHTAAHRDHYCGDYTIWCSDCEMRWQKGDTRTNLVCSNNPQMRNHTGKSFEDMEALVTGSPFADLLVQSVYVN